MLKSCQKRVQQTLNIIERIIFILLLLLLLLLSSSFQDISTHQTTNMYPHQVSRYPPDSLYVVDSYFPSLESQSFVPDEYHDLGHGHGEIFLSQEPSLNSSCENLYFPQSSLSKEGLNLHHESPLPPPNGLYRSRDVPSRTDSLSPDPFSNPLSMIDNTDHHLMIFFGEKPIQPSASFEGIEIMSPLNDDQPASPATANRSSPQLHHSYHHPLPFPPNQIGRAHV